MYGAAELADAGKRAGVMNQMAGCWYGVCERGEALFRTLVGGSVCGNVLRIAVTKIKSVFLSKMNLFLPIPSKP